MAAATATATDWAVELPGEPVHGPVRDADGNLDARWLRGACPDCGEVLVSNLYYRPGYGYLVVWECIASMGDNPTCEYKRVL